jgi:steroid 5-alpha reductase family enzyme
MIHDVATRVVAAWLVCGALQAVLWLVSRRTKNAGIVDVGWALSFSAIVALFGIGARVPSSGWLPLALVVIAWSARLGLYLVWRGAATGPEEGRYVDLRVRWYPKSERNFFLFFQAQAMLAAVLAIAFAVPFVTVPWDGGVVRALGMLITVGGIIGETVADAQLASFKRSRGNKGKVCDIGLWGYSRHPNYFFEWLVWIGYAIYGLAFSGGWIAFAAQAVILGSIWKITGIPATEAQALRSKGDAYRDYQTRVSKFVPLPRR